MEHGGVAPVIVDKDANIVFINEYGEKFFDYNKAEILGKNVDPLAEKIVIQRSGRYFYFEEMGQENLSMTSLIS